MSLKIPFPERERCIYGKNPLVEVLCQIRFPRLLIINHDLPYAFQEEVRQEFPVYAENDIKSIEVNIDGLAGPATKVSDTIKKSFTFSSIDNHWRISLTDESLSLSCFKYTKKEDFAGKLSHALNAFHKVYNQSITSRIGVRYINIIVLDKIENTKLNTISKLISPNLLGNTFETMFGSRIPEEFGGSMIVDIGENTKVRLLHGVVKDVSSQSLGYRIDTDFWLEGNNNFNIDNILKQFESFSDGAGRGFKWGITNELHDTLSPRKI